MSDAERGYISQACADLLPGSAKTFFANMVELAFPPRAPSDTMREGYQRIDRGETTEQQFHNCINYGKGVFRINMREAGYEVYRIK